MEDGSLIMLWTTRARSGYALGYAKSVSGEVCGPWEQMDRPLYAHDGGHCGLFRRLSDNQLMMSMHCADRGPKTFTLFEMEERNGELHIVNEVTGNWMNIVGGDALPYKTDEPCVDAPSLSKIMPAGWEGLKLMQQLVPEQAPQKAVGKAAAKAE